MKIKCLLSAVLVSFLMINVNCHSAVPDRVVDGSVHFPKWKVNDKYYYSDKEKDKAVASYVGISTVTPIVQAVRKDEYDTVLSTVAGKNYRAVASGDQDKILEALKDEARLLRIYIDLNDYGVIDYTNLIEDSKQKISYLEKKFIETIGK